MRQTLYVRTVVRTLDELREARVFGEELRALDYGRALARGRLHLRLRAFELQPAAPERLQVVELGAAPLAGLDRRAVQRLQLRDARDQLLPRRHTRRRHRHK